MQPLTRLRERVNLPPFTFWMAQHVRAGVDLHTAQARYDEYLLAERWGNSLYWVLRYLDYQGEANPEKLPGLIWLSLRRRDGSPCANWRDIQAIKNQLAGPECEMVQLFPAESRRVDRVNQYHLFGFAEPGKRFGFGFPTRDISPEAEFLADV